MQPVMEAMLKKDVRQVTLGNGLYPTDATAQQFGMTKDQLAKIFWDGVNTDYSTLQATGENLKTTLTKGNDVHITNPNGTDLTFSVDGRPWFVSDGVMTKKEKYKGGAALQTWLPAGEVYTAPVSLSCQGKLVIDHYMFMGKDITGLTMTFKNGKVTSMTAASGFQPLKNLYDASGEGKESLAFIDFGINPSVKIPATSKMQSYIPAGMVTLGIGNNTWAGGKNESDFSWSGFLPGSTVTIDGKTLIDKGVLKN